MFCSCVGVKRRDKSYGGRLYPSTRSITPEYCVSQYKGVVFLFFPLEKKRRVQLCKMCYSAPKTVAAALCIAQNNKIMCQSLQAALKLWNKKIITEEHIKRCREVGKMSNLPLLWDQRSH